MIIDESLEFCDATSVAGTAGTALVGSAVDLGVARDIGNAQHPLWLVISCATSIITGGVAGTITFQLASDSAAAIATDGTATEHVITEAFVTDDDGSNDLDAGDLIVCTLLPAEGKRAYERYLGVLAIIATTTVTAGAIDAFLTPNPAKWKALADAAN